MKRSIRMLVVFIGLALATACGSAFAQADSGEGHAKAQDQCNKHEHHRHHGGHCRHHRHRGHCCCDQKEQHSWGHHERFAELATRLSLSDQQKAQIKDVFQKNRPQIKPIVTKLINEKREMRELIQSGSASESAIRAEAAKVAGVEADLAVQRAQMVKQLRANLSPGQIEKFKAIQKERDGKFDKFRERMNEHFDASDTKK